MTFVPFRTLFHPMRRHLFRSFRCFDTFGLNPEVAAANRSRSITCRMDRNNSRGTAIWKITCRELRTTFAQILISFYRNVVNVQ